MGFKTEMASLSLSAERMWDGTRFYMKMAEVRFHMKFAQYPKTDFFFYISLSSKPRDFNFC